MYASSHLDTVGYPGLKFKNDVIMLSSLLFQNKAVLYYFKFSKSKARGIRIVRCINKRLLQKTLYFKQEFTQFQKLTASGNVRYVLM